MSWLKRLFGKEGRHMAEDAGLYDDDEHPEGDVATEPEDDIAPDSFTEVLDEEESE